MLRDPCDEMGKFFIKEEAEYQKAKAASEANIRLPDVGRTSSPSHKDWTGATLHDLEQCISFAGFTANREQASMYFGHSLITLWNS